MSSGRKIAPRSTRSLSALAPSSAYTFLGFTSGLGRPRSSGDSRKSSMHITIRTASAPDAKKNTPRQPTPCAISSLIIHRQPASPNRKLRLTTAITLPYVEYENQRDETRTRPAHPCDWKRRLPIHAMVKRGNPPLMAKTMVNKIDPAIPPRKLRLPPPVSAMRSREELAERVSDCADRSDETDPNLRCIRRHSVARHIVDQIGQHHGEIGAAEVVAGVAQRQEQRRPRVPRGKPPLGTWLSRLKLAGGRRIGGGHTNKVPHGIVDDRKSRVKE